MHVPGTNLVPDETRWNHRFANVLCLHGATAESVFVWRFTPAQTLKMGVIARNPPSRFTPAWWRMQPPHAPCPAWLVYSQNRGWIYRRRMHQTAIDVLH